MSAHDNASEKSRTICDEMVSRLRQKLPMAGLQRFEGEDCCSLIGVGTNVFAYIYHPRCKSTASIHFGSDMIRDLSQKSESVTVKRRPNVETNRDKRAPWIASLSSIDGVDALAEILIKEAYPLAMWKRKEGIDPDEGAKSKAPDIFETIGHIIIFPLLFLIEVLLVIAPFVILIALFFWAVRFLFYLI